MKKVLILLSFLFSNPLSSLAPNSCMINPLKALDSSILFTMSYESISNVNSFRRHLLFLLLESARNSLVTPNFFYPTPDQEDNLLMLTNLFLKQCRSFLCNETSKQGKKVPTTALFILYVHLIESQVNFDNEIAKLDNSILSLYILSASPNPDMLKPEECAEFLTDLIGLSEKYLKYTYIPKPYKEFFNLLSQTNHEKIPLGEVLSLAKQSCLFMSTDDRETDTTLKPLSEDHSFTIRAKNQNFYQLTLNHSFFKETWHQVFEEKKDKEELEKIRSEEIEELKEEISNLKEEIERMFEELYKEEEKELDEEEEEFHQKELEEKKLEEKRLEEKKLKLRSLKADLAQKELSNFRRVESIEKANRENIEKARKDLEDYKKITADKKNANLSIFLNLKERDDKILKEKETYIKRLKEDLSNIKEIEKQKREEEQQILSLYNELSKSDFYSNLMNSILEKNS